ncbi:MAG: GumC family protein [Thermodesulfobacteriota bacterium]
MEDIHIRDYWRIILKRKWTIFTFFTIIVTTVTIGSFATEPVYKATAVIQIEKEAPKVLSFEDILPANTQSSDYYQTQYGILKSRTLAMKVIERLSLQDHPQFKNDKIDVVKNAEALEPNKEIESKERLIDTFLGLFEVEPVKKSRLVNITFDSNYPDLSAEMANTLTQTYIDYTLESNFKAAEKARDWIAGQLGELQAKVETSEERLQAFARKHGIFSLEKDENIILRKLEKLGDALSAAEADRITKEAIYKEAVHSSSDTIPVGTEDEFIKTIKEQYALLEAEYFKLYTLYKPEYPRMVRLKTQMESIDKRIKEETNNFIKRAEAAYKTSLMEEKFLEESFDKQRELALMMKENSIQYNILKREVDTNKELYDGLLQRLKETGVSAGLDSSNIRVVDKAESPLHPSRPRKKLNILLSMIIGLTMGTGIAFFSEYMDNTVKDPEDIERSFNLSTLGLIPSLESVTEKSEILGTAPELISYLHTKSPLSEAFRGLRTSILFSSPSCPPKTLLVTSTVPGEGKTTVSINIGIVLAQAGKKVLIIDGDLRRAGCHKVFSLPSSPGLSNFLTGNANLKSIVKSTKVPGLFLTPAGPISPNPAELLSSLKMRELIKKLNKHIDFIIIDSAPVMGFADTPTLTTMVDGVIMVISGGNTIKDEVKRTLQNLRKVNASILGAVLNKFDISKQPYGYYNSYYYYNKEGDRQNSTPNKIRSVDSLSA